MATALPHAPPTKAAFPHVKMPTALVPQGPAHAEATTAKGKFQSLLDTLKPTPKPAPKLPVPENAAPKPTAKPKAAEILAEKPKDPPKKADPKHSKDHDTDAPVAWMVAVPTPPKPDTLPKAPKVEAETVSTATDKAKSAKTDRKAPGDLGGTTVATMAVVGEGKSGAGAAPGVKADRNDEKPKVFVVDRRSDKEKDKLKVPGAEAAAQQPVNASAEVSNLNKVSDPKGGNDVAVTFHTEATKAPDGFDLKPNTNLVPPRDAATFQQYLVDKGYGQLVDQARIVLKDQNAGEIRMTLYPESLGKVKVALNLSDSSLAGQIFVENQTVKDVFQSNMDGLIQAFRDGGWSDLSLQVSVGNGNAGGQSGQQSARPPIPQARDYDRHVTQTTGDLRADRIGSWTDRQVNLTA